MRKATAYRTIKANTAEELDKLVNKAMTFGWQANGDQYNAGGIFYQPMIRSKK